MALAAVVIAGLSAVIATWGAWSAHRSAQAAERTRQESRQARLDALAPAVNVVGVSGRHERWVAPRFLGQGPRVVPPDTEFVTPRNSEEMLLIGAELLMTNEGATTAIVSVPSHSEFVEGVGNFASHFGPGENAALPPSAGEGQFALGPGRKALLIVRAGHPLSQWVAGESHAIADVAFGGQFGQGVVDNVRVDISAPVIEPVHGDESHFRVVPHTQATATIATTRDYGVPAET